ncbi:MAG: TetR/AcrR family transcriptional regulator [Thermoanaerobaculia bacterium]
MTSIPHPGEAGTVTGKRERILRAAIDVFARSGYASAKVANIAKTAGVADGTIYLYFQGKEDLLITIFREQSRGFLETLSHELQGVEDPREQLRIAIRVHLESFARDRALAIVFQVELRHSRKFVSQLSHEEVAEYISVIRRILEDGQKRGAFRKDWHPQVVAKCVFGMLDEMVTSWILSEKGFELLEQVEPLTSFALRGIE